jgi:exopolysaccharide biosynthesis polyprenyl glycosylphosphotransferase
LSKKRWLVVSIIIDAILINSGIIGAFLLRFGGELPLFNFRAYTSLAVFITVIQLTTLYIYDLYDPEKIGGSADIIGAVLKAVTLGVLLVVFLSFFSRLLSFPRLVFGLSWFIQIVLLSGWRIFGARILKIKWPAQRVLVVGTGESAKEILSELKKRAQWGYEVIGLVDRDVAKVGLRIDGAEVIGTIKDLTSLVGKHSIDRVIVASPVRHREVLEDLAKSAESDVRVEVIPDLYEIFIGRVDHSMVSDIPLVELTKPIPNWVHTAKRLMDILLASLALVLTAPVMLMAAIAIKLSSPGPVIFKQERVGQFEKIFNIYKFRTMIENAEEETGPVLTEESDERVTPVGRFLRKTRIDELPQLINVIKGEMSFVGPRPERPFFVTKFKKTIPGYSERFRIKPGLTGLAQINGGYATNARNKLKYDLIYLYHQSIFLDIKILFKTIKVLLTGRGAR